MLHLSGWLFLHFPITENKLKFTQVPVINLPLPVKQARSLSTLKLLLKCISIPWLLAQPETCFTLLYSFLIDFIVLLSCLYRLLIPRFPFLSHSFTFLSLFLHLGDDTEQGSFYCVQIVKLSSGSIITFSSRAEVFLNRLTFSFHPSISLLSFLLLLLHLAFSVHTLIFFSGSPFSSIYLSCFITWYFSQRSMFAHTQTISPLFHFSPIDSFTHTPKLPCTC